MHRKPSVKLALSLVAAMALTVFLPGPANSAANDCWYFLAGKPVNVTHAVPGPWPNGFGPGACSSGSSPTSFLSTAPACPAPPFVGAVGGQFCGPVFPSGVQVYCTAVAASTLVKLRGIVAGFDQDGDGHLTMADGPVGYSDVPAGTPTVAPYIQSGLNRVIAYPIASAQILVSPFTDIHVGCNI